MDTAQEAICEPDKEYPTAFWSILARRCIKSMHLFDAFELAIIARAFDVHSVNVQGVNIYRSISEHTPLAGNYTGATIVILVDVLSRRFHYAKVELNSLMAFLGKQAKNVMWELSPGHAVKILSALTSAGVKDPALCSRVANKLRCQLDALNMIELRDAAVGFAGQEFRDVHIMQDIARQVGLMSSSSPTDEHVLDAVKKSFDTLGISQVPEELETALLKSSPTL